MSHHSAESIEFLFFKAVLQMFTMLRDLQLNKRVQHGSSNSA